MVLVRTHTCASLQLSSWRHVDASVHPCVCYRNLGFHGLLCSCRCVCACVCLVAARAGSAALMRQAARAATFHACNRSAFKGVLIDKPAMRNVLADLGLETEAAMRMVWMIVLFGFCSVV